MDKLTKFARNVVGLTDHVVSDRYLNLDGSPYGTVGLWRIMRTPAEQMSLGVAVGLGALYGIAAGKNPMEIAEDIGMAYASAVITTTFMQQIVAPLLINMPPKEAVIDKRGELHNCNAHNDVCDYYGNIVLLHRFVAVTCLASMPFFGIPSLAAALSVSARALLEQTRLNKIRNKEWSVTITPPPLARNTPMPGRGKARRRSLARVPVA